MAKKSKQKNNFTKKHRILLVVWSSIILALTLFLWLSPPIPHPDHARFTTLYEDVKYVTEQTSDLVEWSEIKKQCSYSGDVGLEKGGWSCKIYVYDNSEHIVDIAEVAREITKDGLFVTDGVSRHRAILEHQQSGIRCSLSNTDFDKNPKPMALGCTAAAKKPWFQPDSSSQDESLPHVSTWKRYN